MRERERERHVQEPSFLLKLAFRLGIVGLILGWDGQGCAFEWQVGESVGLHLPSHHYFVTSIDDSHVILFLL